MRCAASGGGAKPASMLWLSLRIPPAHAAGVFLCLFQTRRVAR
ncbi:hypothetical protein LC55x_3296 [Lysobacter capsici]|nr:hypothetical protein LC55x_3296 [Lysobacter capsici]